MANNELTTTKIVILIESIKVKRKAQSNFIKKIFILPLISNLYSY